MVNEEQDLQGGRWAVPTKDTDEVSVLFWRHNDVVTDGPVELNVAEPVRENAGEEVQGFKDARFLKGRYRCTRDYECDEHANGDLRPLTSGRLANLLSGRPRRRMRCNGHVSLFAT